MRFTDWLDAEPGRNKEVAEHFGLTPSAITHWRRAVPRSRMRELHAFTQGWWTLRACCPDRGAQQRARWILVLGGVDGAKVAASAT
jgi:hypothetical protein